MRRVRKSERLDQVLMRLGYATQPQIQEAVRRQAERGGRVGMNLVELGAISEEQLFDALVEQFRLPTTRIEEGSISMELLKRMPEDAVVEHLMLPISWDPERKVLSLAVANPSDEETLESVRRAFGAETIRLALARESTLAELATKLMGRKASSGPDVRLVHLPELFGADEVQAPASVAAPAEPDVERILMVTSGPTRKNFLPPVFEREGRRLVVATSLEETVEALAQGPVGYVLVADDIRASWDRWRAEGRVPDPGAEVVPFDGVSSALVDNPLSYVSVAASLRSAVQTIAQFRAAQHRVRPPYGLIANDVDAMARSIELSRVVTDALHLGLHLLVPAPLPREADPAAVRDPFLDFGSSLEVAARLRFPWDLTRLLSACRGLYQGTVGENGASPEMLVAAQVLALAWFRHMLVPVGDTQLEDEVLALRTAMRTQAGRLAPLELVEEYLHLIAERNALLGYGVDRRVLLVGSSRIERALSPALERMACEPTLVESLADAQSTAEREPPAAIVMDHQTFGDEVSKVGRILKLGGRSLLFVLTDSPDQALVLNLLDIGVDDVFGPPHDFDLVAARVSRAIRSRPRDQAAATPRAGQFSATFAHFSFLDLAQMLSHGMKTVRVDLSKSDGERAVLFMKKGRIVHAQCGRVAGPEAVYRVIAWRDDGEFTVREEREFPPATIEASTESLLMEGCRLLDEGSR